MLMCSPSLQLALNCNEFSLVLDAVITLYQSSNEIFFTKQNIDLVFIVNIAADHRPKFNLNSRQKVTCTHDILILVGTGTTKLDMKE